MSYLAKRLQELRFMGETSTNTKCLMQRLLARAIANESYA